MLYPIRFRYVTIGIEHHYDMFLFLPGENRRCAKSGAVDSLLAEGYQMVLDEWNTMCYTKENLRVYVTSLLPELRYRAD